MRGSPIKALKQLFWLSPIAHVKQTWRNVRNPLFWQFNFRKCAAVERKNLFFWQWWSLNRDMNGAECPGWQWWYYELNTWIWCWRYVPDPKTGKLLKQEWGVHPQVFRSFRRHPLVRTAIDSKANLDGILSPIFLTKDEALNAPPPVKGGRATN